MQGKGWGVLWFARLGGQDRADGADGDAVGSAVSLVAPVDDGVAELAGEPTRADGAVVLDGGVRRIDQAKNHLADRAVPLAT